MGSSAILVAAYFYVSHIPAAISPNSRLSNILVRMHQGQPLTTHSLDFLQHQNLPGLYRLACGEITYETYIASLDPACLSRHQAAKTVNQAKEIEKEEIERQALAHYLAQKTNQAAFKATKKRDWEAERNLRRRNERAETEAVLKAQRTRQSEWKAQRERNCELAAAAYRSHANAPGYMEPTALDLAHYFHVEHIATAVSPPMYILLEGLFRGHWITDDELAFLRSSAPDDLYRLASGQSTLDAYIRLAEAAKAEAFARKTREEAAKAVRENDPEYVAMMQTKALYTKYQLPPIDKSLMPRMTKLLGQIDAGNRLPTDDLEWLGTSAKEYFTAPLRKAYHRLEADFHADQYRSTRDPWEAVNACGRYRKCARTKTALDLIDSVERNRLKNSKLRSAVLTTRGGVMRDLVRLPEAIQMGETAHDLMPQDYRPCTLLGAVHMEMRNFNKGHEWYEEARKRGAPEHGIDSDLRSIFLQLDSTGREAMKQFLLAENPDRYGWLKEPRYQ